MTITSQGLLSTIGSFTTTETLGGQSQKYAGNTTLNVSLSYGTGVLTGTLGFNAAAYYTGVLSGGNSFNFDLRQLTQSTAKSTYDIELDKVREFVFVNLATTTGTDLKIRTTGSEAFDALFNFQTGNAIVGPSTQFIFADFLGREDVDASNRYISVHNEGNENVNYSAIFLGVSNALALVEDEIPSP